MQFDFASVNKPKSGQRSSSLVTQEERFNLAKKEKNAQKQRAYRAKAKVRKESLKRERRLKWDKIGGAQKVCMRLHQYDIPLLQRMVQLGTCPAERGALLPTARIASHMRYLG